MIKKFIFVIIFILIFIGIVLSKSNDINLSIVPGSKIRFNSLSLKVEKIYTPGEFINPERKFSLPATLLFFKYGVIRV